MHCQFNLMYLTTLKAAKNRHTIVLGPKFAGIAQFGNIASNRSGGGGGSTSGGGGGGKGKWWCPPPPEVDNELSSNDSEDE
jgi:hypothetical protein